jgi:prepilin-type N-terminal cleavage/methylation domain-containing protein
MESLIILKMVQYLDSKAVSAKGNRCRWLLSLSKSNTGFTLIEVLVTTLIFSILAAITAPTWFAFISQQRLNKANDAILSALQEAQRQARITKHSYSVSFKQDTSTNTVPLFSIYSVSSAPTWTPLGGNINLQPGQVTLSTNISTSTPNTTTASITPSSSPQTITFDYTGALLVPASTGLKIVVAAYQPGTQLGTPINPNVKQQCVIVQTLIGGMQTAQNNGCN